MTTTGFAAVDLGASSGRVIVGLVTPAQGRRGATVSLHEVARFANGPVTDTDGHLRWDVRRVFDGVLEGLRTATREFGPLAGIGVDAWAVDYGLLDDGALVTDPFHYRDSRTDGVVGLVQRRVPPEVMYAITGAQTQPFNTVYQLEVDRDRLARTPGAELLMIPDLVNYWLTGRRVGEVTNASTTQLLDIDRRAWSSELLDALDLPRGLLPVLVEPGTVVGPLQADVLGGVATGGAVPAVIAVGSHDTASAVVGVPASPGERFAYVSCGTWSLVGLEIDRPVRTTGSREANFTNELGVDGTVRFQRNVMGLWLLQESMREWSGRGPTPDLAELLAEAAHLPGAVAMFDVDEPGFLPPGDMPARIASAVRAAGGRVPTTRAETVRAILDSLALAYRRAVHAARSLTGREVDVIRLVGGGARNELLCALTAQATGIPVVAGPVEAAAVGNVLVQARAVGVLAGGLPELRATRVTDEVSRRFEPVGDAARWALAEDRLYGRGGEPTTVVLRSGHGA